MTDILKITKKVFTVGVVATTIMWSVGVAALVPAVANAAVCPTLVSGDMIKVTGKPAIYVLDANGKYRYFADGDVFKSWNADDAYGKYYTSVSQACFDSLSQPSAAPYHVAYRPGSTVVKYLSGDTLYVVKPNDALQPITDAAAKVLYGTGYKVKTIGLSEWPYYTKESTTITEAKAHAGMVVANGGKNWYVTSENKLEEVTATGLTANRLRTPRAVADSVISGLTVDSTKVEAAVAALTERVTGTSAGTPVVTGGALSVTLAANTPAATTLSASTVYNNVLTIQLTAGSEAVAVKGLTVKKVGLVSNTNISGVSVWVEGGRKGDVMSSFNSDNKVTIGFGNTPINISANSSKTVTVALNLGSGATGGTVAAQIEKSVDIDTTASVGGSFPITGNTFALTDGTSTLASVKVEGQSVGGQSSEPSSSDSGTLEVGDTKEIAKFKFTEAGTNDALVEKLTFYVEGSVKESDLKNFELYAPDNTLLGSAESFSDKYFTITLNAPYKIAKGTNRTLTLKATVMDGAANWLRIQLQNDSDLMVKDGGNQFYVLPYDASGSGSVWNGSTAGSGTCSNGYFKIKAGTLTIVKNSGSPIANLAKGSSNVLLGKFDVKAVGEAVEVRKLTMYIATSSVSTRLTGNVKVVVDGSTVLTQSAAANAMYSSSPTQYTLSQYVNIASGETKVFEIYGDIDSNAVTTSEYQAYIGKTYVKRLSSLDYVDNTPNQNVAANNLSLGGNTPSIAKDSALGNKTIAPGATHVLGQWVVRAPESEDIDITGVQVTFTAGASYLEVPTYAQNLALYNGSTPLGSTVSVVATSTNSFTFTLNIPKNTTKVLTLKGYIIGTAVASKHVLPYLDTVSYLGKTTNNSTDDTAGDYAGQDNTVNSATVAITAASDSSTVSKILLPSVGAVQVGKWKVTVNNAETTINKIRFYLDDEDSADTASGNFGALSLYEDGVSTALSTSGVYMPGSGNGYVEFSGLNWTVPADSIKYLVLKSTVNGSGTMDTASYNAWAVGSANTTNYDVTSGGTSLSASVSVSSPTSTHYLFHNAAPTIASYNVGTSLELNSQAKIFGFTVTNSGDRELTLATTSVAISVSGLTAASPSTGTISGFKLWTANFSGGLATRLATHNLCLSGGAGVSGCSVSNSTTTVFQDFTETVTIPAGSSRTFFVTADTTDVLDGKTQGGTVSVSASLDGNTGYVSSDDSVNEGYWANGVILYFYTPVGGSVNTTPYSGSDSYDVVGNALTRSA